MTHNPKIQVDLWYFNFGQGGQKRRFPLTVNAWWFWKLQDFLQVLIQTEPCRQQTGASGFEPGGKTFFLICTTAPEFHPPSQRGLFPPVSRMELKSVLHLRKSPKTWPADALPRLEVALAVKTVAADEGAVLTIGPVPAPGLAPREESTGSTRGFGMSEKQRPQNEFHSDQSHLSPIHLSVVSSGWQQQVS